MNRKYRIGSFNLQNIGVKDLTNNRDLSKIAKIIRSERFDVVALQEVISEGEAFTKDDVTSESTKKSIISYLGGSDNWGFEWALTGDDDRRHEGYAFLWNKKRLRLSNAKVIKNGVEFDRVYYPRMLRINRSDMKRRPFYARFTPQGLPGGSCFEIRLICIHTYFGKDSSIDREIRQNELDVLFKEVYPQISERVYGNGFPNYTVLLGDYNAELVTSDIESIVKERHKALRRYPSIINTDENGEVYSDRYDVKIKTFQYELTTLKTKLDSEYEEFEDRGYASNYDHFSYDESRVGEVVSKKARRVDAVRRYFKDDFQKYYNTVSDHIPIVLELNLNKNQLDVRGLEE